MTELRMPAAIDIEESVLSACILYQDAAEEANDCLIPDDFYKTMHKKIFSTILELLKNGSPIDIAILHEASGISAVDLSRLIETVPVSTAIAHHAEIIKEKATLRRMLATLSKSISECSSANGNAAEVIESVQRRVATIGTDTDSRPYRKMSEITVESVERYEEMQKSTSRVGIMTGYGQIDYITGGFRGPKLVIIAARPGIGKTAFMNCLCKNMAQRGHCIGVFELEMSRDELDDRWFSMMTGINSAKLATGHGLSADDWERISRAAGQKHEWNILVDDSGGLTIEQIRRRAKRMRRDGAEIIFIDQLSKIGGNRKLSSYERNTAHVEEIGWLKKELGIPIVLLCQLNRELEKRTVKYPVLSDLKLTGQIEEEADMVFLGHREYPYTRQDADLHTALWDLSKNRGGPTYRFEMRWEPKTTTFYEIERRV